MSEQLGVHPLVGLLLRRRGLTEAESARTFLHPRLTDLHDPAQLPGVVEASQRIEQAVRDHQPIVIYGDYDVDGITASAILWHTITSAGGHARCYVPHRVEEGYGLNVAALEQIATGQWTGPPGEDGDRASKGGPQPLIVSVDCGITAVGPAQAARDAGVDLIITDHHELPTGPLPAATVLVHPRLSGSQYPYGYLCGAGVAFKLAWQFARVHCGSERVSQRYRELLLDLLSLAALGTVADVVPLVDENRVITSFGLGQIKRTRFAGINAMIDAVRLREERIDAFHAGFVLGPRLNACGRMGHAGNAVHLLTAAKPHEAAEIAQLLTRENERRRVTEAQIMDQATQMVHDAGYDRDDCRAIVLSKEGWHPGVIGIVAARLVDTFARPVVLLTIENGEAQGSARSVEGVKIHEAIATCEELLTSHGGHAMAAGLRLSRRHIDQFRHRFTEHVNAALAVDDLVHTIDVNAPCTLQKMTIDLIDQILNLSPFGRGNPSPLFCLRGVRVEGGAQRVGSEGRHLRLPLRQQDRVVNAIGFGLGRLADAAAPGMRLNVVFEPKVSVWQGRRRPEFHVKDFKPV